MTIQTQNTLYTLHDAGDGGYLISGHPKYCPRPILVTLERPLRVGQSAVFRYNERPFIGCRSHLITSAVQRIGGEGWHN